MNEQELLDRTKKYSLDVLKLCMQLPNEKGYYEIARQLIRCGTSVGANYRAVCRAKSTPDFINKLKIVEEETDESIFFMELLQEINTENINRLKYLIKEGNELLAIFVASIKTVKNKS